MKLILVLSVCVALVGCEEDMHETCKLWKDIARQMSADPSTQMSCVANNTEPCTSLDCQGTYTSRSWVLPDRSRIEVDYCVGIVLNHCDSPVSIEIYMEVPSHNVSHRYRIAHQEMLQIPGMNYQLKNIGQAQGFLQFNMTRTGNNLTFGVVAKVKLTTLAHFTSWPEGLQKVLIPPETIPVPPCKNNETAPTPSPRTCKPPKWRQPTGPTPSTTPQLVTAATRSKTYNKNCSDVYDKRCGEMEVCDLISHKCVCNSDFDYNKKLQRCMSRSRLALPCDPRSVHACGTNEECSPVTKRCQCLEGTGFSFHRQVCTYLQKEPYVPTPETENHVHPSARGHTHPGVSTSVEHGHTSAGVIVGSIIGVVLFIALVAAVFLFVRHWRHRDMHDRSILLINDEAEIM